MSEKQSEGTSKVRAGGAGENSVPGLNSSLEFMGKQLHVQTERIGYPTPRIVTEVFSNGRVVFSMKSEIPVEGPESQESAKIEDRMRTQHLQTIQEIEEKQKRILGATSKP
jgi:hypothetical protein